MHHKSVLIINSANMQPRQKTPKVKFESEENTIEGQASQIEISEDLSDSKWLDKNSLVTKYHLDVLPDKKIRFSEKCISLSTALKIKSNHIMIFSPMHLMLNKKGLSNCHSIIGCINAVGFYKYAQT